MARATSNERTIIPEVVVRTPVTPSPTWKTRYYAIGGVIGLLFGLLSAYFFTRTAEEDVRVIGQPSSPKTGDLITLGLAALALIRQVAELGHDDKTTKNAKR
ncbi:MAG: hypothetical protein IAE89_01950 [Anaerolineae bacterium]|nr:hypothetical protein [Anaerolineae bacterium]